MKNNSLENPKEKIEFLIKKLVDFSNENEFNYKLYKSFAKESSKTFNRYFSEIEDQTIKEKIISDLKIDFHFFMDDIVTSMLAKPKSKIENFEPGVTYPIGRHIPDNRIKDYKNNYKQLIELFLNSVDIELKQPQQIETIELDEVKKEMHNNIFIGNAFEIWERYKENKNITGSSATDLRLIFELMKGDNLLVDTVELKHYITWLNTWYFDGAIITLKKITLTTRLNMQRANDYNEYKRTTLKQP